MTRVSDQVQREWQQALANDGVVTDAEVDSIVSHLLVEIGHNPRDAMQAVSGLASGEDARVANVTAQGALARPRAPGVSPRVAQARQIVVTHNRNEAVALRERVYAVALVAIEDLKGRMQSIRITGSQLRVDDAGERNILDVLESTPAHLRPALAAAIRREPEGLYDTLCSAIDGDNYARFQRFMTTYDPQ